MKDHAGDTQEVILDAAIRHFAEFGYRGASLSKIAEEAKVSKSLIFWYFESKFDLFQSLVERFVGFCISKLDLAGPPGDARLKLDNLIDTYWEFIQKNYKYVRIFITWLMQIDPSKSQGEENQKLKELLRDLHAKFRKILENYLTEGVQTGVFRQNLDIHSTALYIVSSLEGVLLQIFINNLELEQFEQNFFANFKVYLVEGILSREKMQS